MAQASANLFVHLIFSPQERCPSIRPEIKEDLFAYMGGIVRELHGVALIVNGTADHVHLLVRIPPVHAIAEVARVVKANFSVSESSVPAVMNYIAEQENHHRTRSFQEEYLEFWRKSRIAFDERYLWD